MKKLLFSALALAALSFNAQAQVKIGSNPTTIDANSQLEVEATNASKVIVNKTTGNLGIGTITPLQKLHVVGFAALGNATTPGTWTSNGSDILLNTGAANSQIFLRPNGDASTKNQFVVRPQAGHSFFGFDGLEKVRIDTLGYMGLGTTSPTSRLQSFSGSGLNAISALQSGTTAAADLIDGIPSLLSTKRTGGGCFNLGFTRVGAGSIGAWQSATNDLQYLFLNNAGTFTGDATFLPTGGLTFNNASKYSGGGLGFWINSFFLHFGYAYSDGNTFPNEPTMTINQQSKRLGIGTTTPASTLEVAGAATNSSANVVTTASIDYAVSNLAATNNTGTAITLTNLKNGGAYTLVFTSTAASGTVAFTAAGFTFVEVGTVARTAGKKHIYNFIVIGTEVYVTMGTQN